MPILFLFLGRKQMRKFLMALSVIAGFLTTLAWGQESGMVNAAALPTVVILLGPPGSGKGTQAVRLAKELKIPHISTGDLFRENIGQNTELGKKAKSYMDAGQLVPDPLLLEMLMDRVSRPDSAHGYLLDGSPRTIPQAEAIDQYLKGKARVIVINLDVPDEAIVKRIAGRVTCKDCGNIQNLYFSPPKEEGKCDLCGGPMTQRKDDTPEVVKERLRVYHAQTAPLVDYYSKQGNLVTINGQNDPEVIYQQILQAVKK